MARGVKREADAPTAARVRVLDVELKLPRSNLKAKDRGYVAGEALKLFANLGTSLVQTPGVAVSTVT